MAQQTGKPNWLLRGFILISVGVHALVFMHMAGIYNSAAISYIELTMHEFAKPNLRKLPVPRVRQTPVEERKADPLTAQVPRALPNPVPDRPVIPPKIEQVPLPKLPDNISLAGLSVPNLKIPAPPAPAPAPAPAAPAKAAVPAAAPAPAPAQLETFSSARDYFDMLNLRIQQAKRYPESARSRHIQGRVRVQFVLAGDGSLSGIKVVRSSRHRNLDRAAVEAIKKAAPFPRPPARMFKTPITLQINILFELA